MFLQKFLGAGSGQWFYVLYMLLEEHSLCVTLCTHTHIYIYLIYVMQKCRNISNR